MAQEESNDTSSTSASIPPPSLSSTSPPSTSFADPQAAPSTIATTSASSDLSPALPTSIVAAGAGVPNYQQNGVTATLGSPAMSNAPPPAGPPRHPVGYPSPTQYPPAVSMPNQYGYPTTTSQGDPYRASPIHSSATLPGIRSMDHMQQQVPIQPGQMLPMSMAVQGQPYYMAQAPYGHIDPTGMTRYALPPNAGPAGLMGPRGPKKVRGHRFKSRSGQRGGFFSFADGGVAASRRSSAEQRRAV